MGLCYRAQVSRTLLNPTNTLSGCGQVPPPTKKRPLRISHSPPHTGAYPPPPPLCGAQGPLLYPTNPAAVDDRFLRGIRRDAGDPGAAGVLASIPGHGPHRQGAQARDYPVPLDYPPSRPRPPPLPTAKTQTHSPGDMAQSSSQLNRWGPQAMGFAFACRRTPLSRISHQHQIARQILMQRGLRAPGPAGRRGPGLFPVRPLNGLFDAFGGPILVMVGLRGQAFF